MFKKIQTFGLNKDVLIKIHQDILGQVLLTRQIDDGELKELSEFSVLNSKVLLFGVGELGELNTRLKTSIYSNFSPDYEGLNKMIENEAVNRSYKDFSNWVLEKLQTAEKYFIRAGETVEISEEEKKYTDLIDELETFLQGEFAKVLLPALIKIENDIKDELDRIYALDISEEEKRNLADEYLLKAEEEAIKLFNEKLQDNLNNEAIKLALIALGIFDLEKLTKNEIERERKHLADMYLSNVKGFFSKSFRQTKELFFDNLHYKRDLKSEQLKGLSFNKNDFKLSVLTHPRALFRSIIAFNDKVEYYKMVVPSVIIDSLDPSGQTRKYLYQIKTKDEWAVVGGLNNLNVVNGMGIHHNSQEYYYPVFDLEKEKEIAKGQRTSF
jgi:hypothetical protein